ncbi:MAG TPA: chloride channel protein [Clostridia bacterium]|nr:chloride channel protein [Clostridia bacterium]
MIYAILIGLITAIVSFVFNTVLGQLIVVILDVNNYFFNAFYFPILGGILLGLMNKYLITENRAFEVVAIEEEIEHIEEHLLEVKSVLLKTFASIISLAFGFSLGKQGTIVYLGGSIGSYFGYQRNQSTDDIKTMIGCGVSGMISGIFGMPLLGIVLVNEVIIKERQLKRTFYISVSAIVTFLFTYYVLEVDTFITLFKRSIILMDLSLHYIVILGISSGAIALLYSTSIKKITKTFLNKKPFLTPIVASILITITGIHTKWIYSMHFDSLEFLYLEEQLSVLLLFILIKLLITGISYNFGGYGGVFLPGIIIGAVLGKIFFLMSGYANASTSMILAIAGVFAGFSGGPLTGIILGFSLSGYNITLLIPLSIVSFIAYYIVKKSKMGFLY